MRPGQRVLRLAVKVKPRRCIWNRQDDVDHQHLEHSEVVAVQSRLEAVEAELETAYARWAELDG